MSGRTEGGVADPKNTGFGVRQTQMLSEGYTVISFALYLLWLYWYQAGPCEVSGNKCLSVSPFLNYRK